jgi:plasmid stabilization system protein ParE
MTRRFIVRPLAEADLENAARWYDEERPGLADRFLSDVDQTFVRIRERPLKFPTFLHVAARRLGPLYGPYMRRGLRAGFRLDAMIRRASRRWLSSASSAI